MVLKIGHRGAKGYEPENTLRSFEKAIKLGADYIEFDVRKCRTGEAVIMHDSKVNRTTNGKGHISNMSLETLKKLNAGKGETIPLVTEALDFIDKRAKLHIELKGRNTSVLISKIIKKYVKGKWNYDDFIISSFLDGEIVKFKKLCPKVKTEALLRANIRFRRIKVDIYSVDYRRINKEYIDKIHKKKIKVFVWTVNDKKKIKEMKKMGVDGIISDFPDRI